MTETAPPKEPPRALSEAALDQLFRDARTHNTWLDRAVPESLLHELVNLAKLAPTSANCSPARFVFVTSDEAKKRLGPHLSEGNFEKTMAERLAMELTMASRGEGNSIKKREDTHRMAEANRAFAHYRW